MARGAKDGWALAAGRDDELRADARAGRCLAGFDEGPLDFAPTFKRSDDPDADPGDVQGYALAKEDATSGAKSLEERLRKARDDLRRGRAPTAAHAAAKHGLRYPSWTDRALHASLPGRAADLTRLE